MGSDHYCLRWNNHQNNLLGVFSQLLRDESLVDVTLACSEGHSIRAHKVVLSACSSYFQTLFVDHPSRHPIVILKDVRFSELRTLIDFMYKGEVNVEYCQLSALLKTAESLKVKGLAEMTRDYKAEPIDQPQPSPPPAREDSNSTRTTSPAASHNLRVCKMMPDHEEMSRPPSTENSRAPGSPISSNEALSSEMTPSVSGNLGPSTIVGTPALCQRLDSPISNEAVPGPSILPPVQKVPLSLKKEADWGGGLEEKPNLGESSSDYSRHQHDSSIADVECCLTTSFAPERPSSTQSSRSSTPFNLPFSALPTSLFEINLIHPALFGEEMLRCTACMAAFPSVWLLEQHVMLQHIDTFNSVDKPFVCDQCGQSYRYRSAYVKHREQNHRARLPADKLFSCDVCGMQFRYLKSFKKHRLNHALEKLHGKNGSLLVSEMKCSSSSVMSRDSAFSSSSDQVSSSNETLVTSENESGSSGIKKEEENNDASECVGSDAEKEQDDAIDSMSTGFADIPEHSKPELVRSPHQSPLVNFLNDETTDRQRERRFACPFCGKCVRSKENLKLHVRKHTGERPFVCLFCGRAFGGKSDLTRHLRIHTGERPYHCDMCGKCFARADYLSKHLTTHISSPR